DVSACATLQPTKHQAVADIGSDIQDGPGSASRVKRGQHGQPLVIEWKIFAVLIELMLVRRHQDGGSAIRSQAYRPVGLVQAGMLEARQVHKRRQDEETVA